MESGRHLWMLLLFAFLSGGQCLSNVSLLVFPPAVQRGQDASLLCRYDLEGAALYSVKWYRGSMEFYRFSPSETPATKIFPYTGIHVDLSVSNETQVVLRRVGFNLSGNFSCEVTVEAPSFSTKTVQTQMLVVSLPRSPPEILVERHRYDPGDTLQANCTSAPSKPAASLSFLLNNIPVGVPDVRQSRAPDHLETSSLSLSMQLYPSHFAHGQLVLKCTAHMSTLYRQTTEVLLGSRAREPVPERVTSPNGGLCLWTSPLLLLLLVLCCLTTR